MTSKTITGHSPVPDPVTRRGTVTQFDSVRGTGWAVLAEDQPSIEHRGMPTRDLYLSFSEIQESSGAFRTLAPGEIIEFEAVPSKNAVIARNIRRLGGS